MAEIDDLIKQVNDPALQQRLNAAVQRLAKRKKFGIEFERHLPERTLLYEVPVKRGSTVVCRGKTDVLYDVVAVADGNATCISRTTKEQSDIPVANLVCIAEFGEPIFPYLELLDSVENAPDSSLWHTLIEADNYHALQLLEYMYHGKVDCIYIDPPYNSGAKDWKYNNNYVDGNDNYRHSKWLSMMEKRLLLAKKLLNPNDSVLIVTIDEKEYIHLGCLLEDLFPEAQMQMISDVINPRGTTRDGSFSRTDEYIYVLQFGSNSVFYPTKKEKHYVEWYRLRRTDFESRRGTTKGGTQQFYPIYVDVNTEKIVHIGDPIPVGQDRHDVPAIDGAVAVFPVKNDGTEMNWGVTPDTLKQLLDYHFVRVRKNSEGKPQPYLIHYISYVQIEAIKSGRASIEGYNEDGTAIVVEESGHIIRPGSAWNISTHNAGTYGSEVLASLVGGKKFTFPKSIYSTHDVLNYFLSGKPDAFIVDFFAGSGTTLNAVNLLNSEDNGNRRCVLVTNNEVSEAESKMLSRKGLTPGNDEWDKLGIARHVTWPRTKASIIGKRDNGDLLEGDYFTTNTANQKQERNFSQVNFLNNADKNIKAQFISLLRDKNGKNQFSKSLIKDNPPFIVSDNHTASILFDDNYEQDWYEALESKKHITDFYICTDNKRKYQSIKENVINILGPIIVEEPVKRPMSDGFPTNANFFKLGFLDKDSVAFGAQLEKLIPVLWMKAGAIGKCPNGQINDKFMVYRDNKFAILIDTKYAFEFRQEVENGIEVAYIITDYEPEYREISNSIKVKTTYHLYRDYLDNFKINIGRI